MITFPTDHQSPPSTLDTPQSSQNFFNDTTSHTLKGIAYTALGLASSVMCYYLTFQGISTHTTLSYSDFTFPPCFGRNCPATYRLEVPFSIPFQALATLSSLKGSYDSLTLAYQHFYSALHPQEQMT